MPNFVSYDDAVSLMTGIHNSLGSGGGSSATAGGNVVVTDGIAYRVATNTVNRATQGFSQIEITDVEASDESPYNLNLVIPEDEYYMRPPLEVLKKVDQENAEQYINVVQGVELVSAEFSDIKPTKMLMDPAGDSHLRFPFFVDYEMNPETVIEQAIGENEIDEDPEHVLVLEESVKTFTTADIDGVLEIGDLYMYNNFSHHSTVKHGYVLSETEIGVSQ